MRRFRYFHAYSPPHTPVCLRSLLIHIVGISLIIVVSGGLLAAQPISATEQLARQYPDSAYRLLKVRLDQAVTQNDKLTKGDRLQQLGSLFYHQGSNARAINYLIQAKKFHVAQNNNRLARNCNELGTVYYYNENRANGRWLNLWKPWPFIARGETRRD